MLYKIGQKAMTVEQVWDYGRERGHELYSPVTSSVEYKKDKNSFVVYWASIDLTDSSGNGPNPVLTEFRYGEKEPAFEMKLHARSATERCRLTSRRRSADKRPGRLFIRSRKQGAAALSSAAPFSSSSFFESLSEVSYGPQRISSPLARHSS